jgi:ankyrin repeat protein
MMSLCYDLPIYGLYATFAIALIVFVRVARGSGRGCSIMTACLVGDLEEVRWLLRDARWLARAADASGITPLHSAALAGHPDIVWLLLQYKAGINARNNAGQTPLHAAAIAGRTDSAAILLRHGAEVDARDNRGNTPLYCAAWDGNIEMVNLLLAHGADIDARTHGEETSLLRARRRGHEVLAAHLEKHRRRPPEEPRAKPQERAG